MMVEDPDRLTTPSHWARRGDEIARYVDVPRSCWFLDQAELLEQTLVGRGYSSAVELGAYPGHVLNWLCRTLELRGTAVEYVPVQARALAKAFPAVEVLQGDFLSELTFAVGRTWDVVFSLGLVEHWSDLRVPLARHAQMTAPGGTCVVGIPLHDGVYGRLMRFLDPALHAQHGCYSLDELHDAFLEAAGSGWRVEICQAVEGIGFWNCGLGEWVNRRRPAIRAVGFKVLGAWHRTVTHLPAPPALRPNGILIARRA
jgi:SAM-dependent methyltransferase